MAGGCKGGKGGTAADAGRATDVVQQLEREAKARATGTPTPEQIFDALDGAGLRVTSRKQVVAMTMGASYCLGGIIEGHARVLACEFPDEREVQHGANVARNRIKPPPRRDVFVNKSSMLAVTLENDAGSEEQLVTTAKDVFAKL